MAKKVYHIHTDFKFLYDSGRFENDLFKNQIIFIGNKIENNKAYHDSAIFFPFSLSSIPEIIKLIEDADLVVMYDLCDFKKELLKNMPTSSKVAWRFFGYEYYATRRDLMLTKKTMEIVENKNKYKSKLLYKLNLYLKLRKRRYLDSKDLAIVNKIDYILLFCKEEYDYLRKYWKVPKFIKLSLDFTFEEKIYSKANSVIVGNSRNIYNNHIDILDLIKTEKFETYTFNLFFNYGANGIYADHVADKASRISNIKLITEFLSKDYFEEIYQTSSALVINSHRQMALGNIFSAIRYGLKIYLNDKNPIKNWLKTNGLLIFSISDLKLDLTENNMTLSDEEMIINIKKFNKMSAEYDKAQFCDNLNKLL